MRFDAVRAAEQEVVLAVIGRHVDEARTAVVERAEVGGDDGHGGEGIGHDAAGPGAGISGSAGPGLDDAGLGGADSQCHRERPRCENSKLRVHLNFSWRIGVS